MVQSCKRITCIAKGIALLVYLILTGGCAQEPPRPNIVLITIDTLRTDHLSCYGYERKTTPFIDRLAEEGILFTECRATSSWTAPSMASIFTALYPLKHGVRNGIAVHDDGGSPDGIQGQELLSEDFLTLAEALRNKGYRTFGISSNLHITPGAGMAQGFDRFTSLGFCSAPLVNRAALALKEELEEPGPYFLWIHYFDPHIPYEKHSPWYEEYASQIKLDPALSSNQLNLQEEAVLDKKIKELAAGYDSEINFTDDHVKALFDQGIIKREDWLVITSDHGEEFGEHGMTGHGKTLYDEVVKVPLIMAGLPEPYRGKVINESVSINDIYPTLLDFLNMESESTLDGRSLRGCLLNRRENKRRPIYSELTRNAPLKCLVWDSWKLITVTNTELTVQNKEDAKKRTGLFHLGKDPEEKENLITRETVIADKLKSNMKKWKQTTTHLDSPKVRVQLTPEEKEKMRALGY